MAELLPEMAIQHIQSFLKTKEAARSCLLSKSWLRSWSTHPDLDFDQSFLCIVKDYVVSPREYDKIPGIEEVRKKFVDFVNNTLVNYTAQKLSIRKFRLSAEMLDCETTSDIIDQWIHVVMDSGTSELHLALSSYTLPETIFSTKSLEVLDVAECNLRANVRIGFCNLKTLVLSWVDIDEHTIAELISSIPLAEKIILTGCRGFIRIKVANLYHLKIFEFNFAQKNQILEIEAPNLESFSFSSLGWSEIEPPLFYMKALSNLKKIDLFQASITDMIFHDLVPRFTLIKVLSFSSCDNLERINISSPSLEHLSLRDCHNLQRINISSCSLNHLLLTDCNNLERSNISSHSLEYLWISGCQRLVAMNNIDAPNLRSFHYTCESLRASVSFFNNSAPRRSWIFLPASCCGNLNTSWFLQLRGFLMNINRKVFSLNVFIKSSNQNSFSSASFLQALEPSQAYSYMTKVEYLSVDIEDSPSISYPALLDGLIWSCHPKNLTLTWKDTNSDKVSKAFAEELRNKLQFIDQNPKTYGWQCIEDGEEYRRNATNYNHWLHYLKDAKTLSWQGSQFKFERGRDEI